MVSPVLDAIDPRVLGARLQEARKAAGATQQAIADELGIGRTTLVAIEKGERRVTADELVKLARLYGRSVSDLVSRRTVVEAFVPQFRTSLRKQMEEDPEFDRVTATLQSLAEDYVELEQILDAPLPRAYPVPRLVGSNIDQSAEDIALSERNRLGLGDGPVPELRSRLESDIGLRIFFFEMPSTMAGLFVYNDTIGGCIGINASHPYERQNWSLAHEYGHFLTSRFAPEIQLLAERPRVRGEIFANEFAKHFLMPAAGLNRRFSEIHQSRDKGATLADVCTVADSYQVSVEALIRRLEELKRLPAGMWNRLTAQKFKPREAQAALGLARDHRHEKLPARFVYLAVQAFRDGLLTEGQLARYLRTDRVSAREMVELLETRLFSEHEGRFEMVVFDLAQPLGMVEG